MADNDHAVRTDYIGEPFDAHCCHMGTAIKHPLPERVKPSFVIFDVLTLRAERQSARMSKITNDGLTQCGIGCFIAVTIYGNSGCQRVNSDCDCE